MMYFMSFVRRSTHTCITVNFLSDLHDIFMQYNYEYTNFFIDFFPGKCRSMKIPKLGNARYEK